MSRVAFVLLWSIVFVGNLCAADTSSEAIERKSRAHLNLSGHVASITGKIGDLIDRSKTSSNDKVIYGLSAVVLVPANNQLEVGVLLESSWWNGKSDVNTKSIGLAGAAYLKNAPETSPYLGLRTGFMTFNFGATTLGEYMRGDNSWFLRLALGFSFVSSKGHLSHIEVFYSYVPVDVRVPLAFRPIVGRNPDLTYLGAEFGFGIPL